MPGRLDIMAAYNVCLGVYVVDLAIYTVFLYVVSACMGVQIVDLDAWTTCPGAFGIGEGI